MTDILVVEDTPESQAFIRAVLSKKYTMHVASSGEEGLQLANSIKPEAIILDVNLPGIDGYEVCRRLKASADTGNIPIVFLSANSDVDERMQGFEAGGDDYLVKPCEPKTLRAKIEVLLRYRDNLQNLKQQYKQATEVANIAMAGSSELGLAMQFVSSSYGIQNYADLANAFFAMCVSLGLNCSLMFVTDEEPLFFSASGPISPLEEELLEMLRKEKRIVDFGARTVINYPTVSLLIKNMPVNDKERYGRTKDLMPIILSVLNGQIYSLCAESQLKKQSSELSTSFAEIKASLLQLGELLAHNQGKSVKIMRNMMFEMSEFLPKLGLEDDQEDRILNHIEKVVEQSVQVTDSSVHTEETFQQVIQSLEQLLFRQTTLIEDMSKAKKLIGDVTEQAGKPATYVDLF